MENWRDFQISSSHPWYSTHPSSRDRGLTCIYCYDLGVRDKIIDCLYVYLLYFLCATHDLLFLFRCYSIRDACTAVRVAQCVCVYEWTIIYISGIVIANIYCMYIVILYAKVCMVKNKIKFVLIV